MNGPSDAGPFDAGPFDAGSAPSIRMLASDLDGTLLRSDASVSERTRAALAAAEQAGLVIVFVTGRPPRWLTEIADATGHTGIAVAANGAMLYDLHTETVVAEHLIQADALFDVTTALRAQFPSVRFGIEYGLDFGYESEYLHDWEITPLLDRRGQPMPVPLQASLAELIDRPAIKLLAKDLGADPDEFLRIATTVVGDRATLTRSGSSALLEISAPGITKATGLAALAHRHEISADDVAAVGDMPNDVPMLIWAGHPYAMANAHPAVFEVARRLDHTNDEDAVARLIESILAA